MSLALHPSAAPAPAVATSPYADARRYRVLRLARVGWHLARGMGTAAWALRRVDEPQRREHVRSWSQGLLDALAVELRVAGAVPAAGMPAMIVANHVSWLDVIAINAVLPARFVAKREVRAWPAIGWLSERASTLYLERGRRRDAARIGGCLERALGEGATVAVFPEGTCTDGSTVLPFHGSLIEAAVRSGVALSPVAIRIARADGSRCEEAAYCGDRSLPDTLAAVAGQQGIRVEVNFLRTLETRGRHRRELAQAAREAILRSLFP